MDFDIILEDSELQAEYVRDRITRECTFNVFRTLLAQIEDVTQLPISTWFAPADVILRRPTRDEVWGRDRHGMPAFVATTGELTLFSLSVGFAAVGPCSLHCQTGARLSHLLYMLPFLSAS